MLQTVMFRVSNVVMTLPARLLILRFFPTPEPFVIGELMCRRLVRRC